MTAKELNSRLITAFPDLSKAYHECVDWQDGNDTGSHVVYRDVLVPVMLALIKGNKFETAKRYFDFIEDLLALEDEYATDIVTTTVLEDIFLDDINKERIKPLLGAKALTIWKGFEEW